MQSLILGISLILEISIQSHVQRYTAKRNKLVVLDSTSGHKKARLARGQAGCKSVSESLHGKYRANHGVLRGQVISR